MQEDGKKEICELEERLRCLDAERHDLMVQLSHLRQAVSDRSGSYVSSTDRNEGACPETEEEKANLFMSLFACRRDVFPKRWESRTTGKSGYSPACQNEWVSNVCQKHKCTECPHRKFVPLDTRAVETHLNGSQTIGTYAIDTNDNCIFLACDFDEGTWQKDIVCYRDTALEIGVAVALERSRSGNGAHAWIFFEERVPARFARQLGTVILVRCAATRPQISFDSYDRFFPNQDYLPKGGFGNLIALPLQKIPCETGNSCFLDHDLSVLPDQWAFLSRIKRPRTAELLAILERHVPPIKTSPDEEAFRDSNWATDQAIIESKVEEKAYERKQNVEGTVEITLNASVRIPLSPLPRHVIAKLRKAASFANPEFYRCQRMRLPTYKHPRFIFSGQVTKNEIVLPRGILDEAMQILWDAYATLIVRDERLEGKPLPTEFLGTLNAFQEKAVKTLVQHDVGVLVAPPGAGKTVMGCAVIAQRKVSTLVLVHRRQILDQWKQRIATFLSLHSDDVGVFGGTKKNVTGKLDLAMLQTLIRMDDFTEIAGNYAQIIIDECHHIPATSFEAVLKQIPARYVLGLTATPNRKDGLQKILFHQSGPIRYEVESVDGGFLTKRVTITETKFRPANNNDPYHVLIQALVRDKDRNRLIVKDAVSALLSGRCPILLSDRKEHLDLLSENVLIEAKMEKGLSDLTVVRLDGELSQKQREAAINVTIQAFETKEPLLLVASSALIGEGFDLPSLDTLILATPLSFGGRLTQYVGRLHRVTEGKSDVRVFDYLDSNSSVFLGMYRKRRSVYRKMGYLIDEPEGLFTRKTHSRESGVNFIQRLET